MSIQKLVIMVANIPNTNLLLINTHRNFPFSAFPLSFHTFPLPFCSFPCCLFSRLSLGRLPLCFSGSSSLCSFSLPIFTWRFSASCFPSDCWFSCRSWPRCCRRRGSFFFICLFLLFLFNNRIQEIQNVVLKC